LDKSNYTFIKATPADAESVLAAYRSIVGTPGCSWNEYYPNEESVNHSIENGSQYLLHNESGELVAMCCCGYGDEIDDPLFAWQLELENPCYFGGMGVLPKFQGKGIAKHMVTLIIEEAVRRGYDGAVALVAVKNEFAQKAYREFGFSVTGQAEYYGQDYYLYETKFRK